MVPVVLEFDWMHRDTCLVTYYLFADRYVSRAIHVCGLPQFCMKLSSDEVNLSGLLKLFESRVLPKQRFLNDASLQKLVGGQEWEPMALVRLTHGVRLFDDFWIRFADERSNLDWQMVSINRKEGATK